MLPAKDLTALERRVVQGAKGGLTVDVRVGDLIADDPARGASWDPARTVRAELLVQLLTLTHEHQAIKLAGVRVSGLLDLEGVTLGRWLVLSGCWFDCPVTLAHATAPTIRMPGCHLSGLTAENLRTSGDLSLDSGFTFRGEVNLARAQIGGMLSLAGAELDNPGGISLDAGRLTTAHHLRLDEGFTARGEVHLAGAQISGDLVLTGATITNRCGTALIADHLAVTQSTICDGLTVEGQIRATGARVGGSFRLGGAHLAHPGEWALTAPGLTVGQEMFCGDGFTSQGGIDLRGSHIGALMLDGATLNNPGGMALEVHWSTVDRQVSCRHGFTALGEFSLYGASVGTRVDLRDGTFSNPGDLAIEFERLKAPALYLLPRSAPDGLVDLSYARVGTYHDDPASWPDALDLRGFVYEMLVNDQVDVRSRLRWLRLQPGGYLPQPYDQLATAYRNMGREDAARLVAIEKQRRRRHALNPAGKLVNRLLQLTVGYGYRTWLAALWLAGLLALGTTIFAHAYPRHMTATTTPAPAFHPVAYSLDVLVPIADLGQQKTWTPTGGALYWSWALSAVGWVLTTAVVAGLSGVLKRD
jgi:hypothetical protein